MNRRHFVTIQACDVRDGDRICWPPSSGAWSGEIILVSDVESSRNSIHATCTRTLPPESYVRQTGLKGWHPADTLLLEVLP